MQEALPEGVWISLSEIAAQRGVSKVAIKKRVDRLEAEGLLTTRRDGSKRLVDLAAFNLAIGDAGDASRETAAETVRETAHPANSKLRDAQTEKAQWEARARALDVSERMGRLVPVKGERGIEAAMIRAGEAIVRAVEQVPTWAGDLTTIAIRDGEPGVRRELRRRRDELRAAMATALSGLADEGRQEEAAGGYDVDMLDDLP
jgi:DNA-binding Lrp family transcriptional regulator